MNKKSTESGEVEERPQGPAAHPFIGTSMRSRQGPLLMPQPGDTRWPDLRGNPDINAKLVAIGDSFLTGFALQLAPDERPDRLVPNDESSVDQSEAPEQAGTESDAGGALRPR